MKVSRKVGRRSRKHTSSVSRRRLRNKKSRSGYKKRYAKTQRGGARSRKYGHKRGKRFHRGGGLTDIDPDIGDQNETEMEVFDYEPTTQDPKLTTSDIPIPSLTCCQSLPNDIFRVRTHTTKMENALYFEYERTDGRRHKLGKMLGVGKPVRGLFDIVILWTGTFERSQVSHIFLLRRIKNKNDEDEYDKKFIIDPTQFAEHFKTQTKTSRNAPFTDILGYDDAADYIHYIDGLLPENTSLNTYNLPKDKPATYTLPATKNNIENLKKIKLHIVTGTSVPHMRTFQPL